jgi:ethanolamine utilization protein EutA
MADSRDLLSVGVDVGTTTTQIIFSRLNLQDVSRPGQIPRIDITDRRVIYQSPIVFTPLIDSETIDADRSNRSAVLPPQCNPNQVETVIHHRETRKRMRMNPARRYRGLPVSSWSAWDECRES